MFYGEFGLNVSDVQDAVETAVGGKAQGQVLQGEQRCDLMVRYLPEYRTTVDAIRDLRILAPSAELVALEQVCTIGMRDGASQIYR
jgi:heavy metal efflux system protein